MLRVNFCTRFSLAIATTLLTILFFSSSFAAVELNKRVSVVFNGDKVSLPTGKALHSCDSTTILSNEVLEILGEFHSVFINREFDDDDTTHTFVEGRDGIMVCDPSLAGFYTLTFEDSTAAAQATVNLLHTQDVLAAVQEGMDGQDAITPNDDFYDNEQWSLNNSGQTGGTANADINAPEAWEYTTGSPSVKIALIDSGVLSGHDDLSGKVSGDPPTTNGGDNWDPYHGTHVAGIAAAKTNNDEGIAGVDWAAPIISKDIANQSETVKHNKIKSAVDLGAAVLNNSWGYRDHASPAPAVIMAYAYAYNMDRVIVASAGNENSSGPHYPSDLKKLISGSGTNHNDARYSSSNYGSEIDIAAPAANVYSCYDPSYAEYFWLSGTSMAAPHVSGVAALLKSYYPNLWNDDIRHIMEHSAYDRGATGWDQYFGWGRLDADNAFKILEAPNLLVQSSGGETQYSQQTTGDVVTLWGVNGFANGNYILKRYEVKKTVTFPREYYYAPRVWGRGAASSSYQLAGATLYDFRDCQVSSSITATGCELSTYVYDVYAITGQHISFIPTSPDNVTFAWSVLGELTLQSITSTTVTPEFASDRVLIQWDDPNPNEQRILIKRRTSESGSFLEWAELGANITSTFQTSLNELVGSQLYFYKVYPEQIISGVHPAGRKPRSAISRMHRRAFLPMP